MSGPAISKHLRVLERAGLVQRGREAHGGRAPRRLAHPRGRRVGGEFRRFWDASYARLDNYLDLLKKEEKKHAKRS
jgi:DNA-binding MarR family transcriptional regulator